MIIENIHFSSEMNSSHLSEMSYKKKHKADAVILLGFVNIIKKHHFPQASFSAAQKPLYHSSKFSSVSRDAAASARDMPSATI